MAKKHSKKIIAKAIRLHRKGVPLRSISKMTGIKSTSTILFHCDPKYREIMIHLGRVWRKKNAERWREICRKAEKNRKSKSKK